ncbi:cytochrome c3 family protein [uncultured Desulfuromusa sp.]|uniref:cytochrome c3 family protein n=1 Tax=uncultured Desulfuromusa sp. TaxID=219183 RepID=UPI002AA6AE03|nr:cytochrome c3 family protein [uncultured Desulfuromusa sp.]
MTNNKQTGKSRLSKKIVKSLLFAVLSCLLLVGCGDPVTRHKVLSTIFDGVPSLPPAGEMCAGYDQKQVATEAAGLEITNEEVKPPAQNRSSSHKPYKEKKCHDCHSNNKNVNAGLIAPKRELCGVCHQDFIKSRNIHGPVAVGDCLACHLPHNSQYPSLLKEDPEKICATCHEESRLAAAMHDRFVVKTIGCDECHDPHAGDARYFLK